MQTITIRAAVLRGRGPLKIETLDMEGPRDDETLVRLAASGICRTDIDICDSWDERETPAVLGHEGAGVVEQVGRGVEGVKRGDHVVLSYDSCGNCAECRDGRPAHCRYGYELNFGFRRLDGTNPLQGSGVRGRFFGQSSFASHAVATERNLVRVSKKLPLEILAPLGCGFQTGAGTIMNSLKVAKGESVAVFGTGSVGLAAVMAARLAGAAPIIGVDIVPRRLKLAIQLGATHAVDARRGEIAGRVRGMAGGGVDYVVETTGEPEMHRLAVEILNLNGAAALLTGEDGKKLSGGRRTVGIIEGDAVPQQFIPRLIRLYRRGRFPFDRLLKFYPFRDINRAMADARRGVTVKPVLLFP